MDINGYDNGFGSVKCVCLFVCVAVYSRNC